MSIARRGGGGASRAEEEEEERRCGQLRRRLHLVHAQQLSRKHEAHRALRAAQTSPLHRLSFFSFLPWPSFFPLCYLSGSGLFVAGGMRFQVAHGGDEEESSGEGAEQSMNCSGAEPQQPQRNVP